MIYIAYLGSCSASKDLVYQLLELDFTNDFMLVGKDIAQRSFLQLSTSIAFAISSTTQTILLSTLDGLTYSNILSQYSIHDRACLLAYACDRLQVLSSSPLGLAIPPVELAMALHIWLGIPVY